MNKMQFFFFALFAGAIFAADEPEQTNASTAPSPLLNAPQKTEDGKANGYVVSTGVKIPLSLMNTLSSKQTAEGDRVYLETVFPVLVDNKIVIPPGSYVTGTVTEVKRPGRVKGKGELYVRFDSLILPNGVLRNFTARIGGMDGGGNNELDRDEGRIKGGGDKAGNAQSIAQAAQMGTMVGGVAGAAAGRPGVGLATGAAGGAAAGLLGVLLTRGPDVVLPKGTMLEMVLDRSLEFTPAELDFGSALQNRPRAAITPPPPAENKSRPFGSWFPF
jgi:type IV secretion system protein VirB10